MKMGLEINIKKLYICVRDWEKRLLVVSSISKRTKKEEIVLCLLTFIVQRNLMFVLKSVL